MHKLAHFRRKYISTAFGYTLHLFGISVKSRRMRKLIAAWYDRYSVVWSIERVYICKQHRQIAFPSILRSFEWHHFRRNSNNSSQFGRKSWKCIWCSQLTNKLCFVEPVHFSSSIRSLFLTLHLSFSYCKFLFVPFALFLFILFGILRHLLMAMNLSGISFACKVHMKRCTNTYQRHIKEIE